MDNKIILFHVSAPVNKSVLITSHFPHVYIDPSINSQQNFQNNRNCFFFKSSFLSAESYVTYNGEKKWQYITLKKLFQIFWFFRDF